MRELTVQLGERSYPIYIGRGVLSGIGERFEQRRIPKRSPVLIVTDSNVAPLWLGKVEKGLAEAGYRTAAYIAEAGEKAKTLSELERIVTAALEAGLDRHSAIVALGGGVIGDLAGFAAASFMRGIRFIQVPTTVLAHDSSVGGKVAVNHPVAKNSIGAFHQPEMVLYDLDTLDSLPAREIRAGFAEVVKHGLIWDRAFADWLDEHAEALLKLEAEPLMHALYEGCRIKATVVSKDERENDLRAILNYGHTIGHAIEAVGRYEDFLHGEAISIGMVGAARLAEKFGRPPAIAEFTERLLKKFGLPTVLPMSYSTEDIMAAMMHDKKFVHGQMTFIVATEIGSVEIRKDVQADWVRETVDRLKGEASVR